MDFKKISRIFIIAFLLLNVYLIFGVLRRQGLQYTTLQPNNSDVFANMKELDIDVPNFEDTDISNREIYSLQINTHELLEEQIKENKKLTGSLNDDQEYYDSFPSKPIELKGNPEEGFEEEDYELLMDFVSSENVMFGEEYSNIHYEVESRRFVLNQYINEIPITDGTSEISLFVNESGEIYAFQQTYAGPGTNQGKPLDLIDSSRAIEILFLNNKIQQGAEVKTPVLTYRRALHLEDLSMYSPVWSVDIEESSERNSFFVDAVDGTIIKQSDASQDPSLDSDDTSEDSEEDTR